MSCYSERVIEKQLALENEIDYDVKCKQYVFSKCRNIKPISLYINTKLTKHNWQIGFFDADGEVYFDQINIQPFGCFSSIVRNYWQNGKKGEKKREGYYSLIKLAKRLIIYKKHVNDFLDYVEGRYEAGEHWQIHELDRNMELIIEDRVKQTTQQRLAEHFDNIRRNRIIADLKTENNIIYDCKCHQFENCKGVVPQRLIISAFVEKICFYDFDDALNEVNKAFNIVHIPEIVMEEKAELNSIIQSESGYYSYKSYTYECTYTNNSLLPYVQTLVIRNNPKVLCDLADYINGRYEIYGWQLDKLNKNMKIVIEEPGIAFGAVKEITDHFVDVMVDDNKPEEYLAREQSYQKQFQEYFDKYDLETDWIGNIIPASQELKLENEKLNVGNSSRKVNRLYVDQKLAPQQFICFHDTDELVVINEILINDDGNLRCVLQNSYYDGMDSGFFSLLKTAKKLEIDNNKQVIEDLADYIDGKYALHYKWERQVLDRDMEIKLRHNKYTFPLDVARKLRNYFRNVFIDYIYTSLETENIIDQECEYQYIFSNCRDANPYKLVVNAKLKGYYDLILFDDADDKVYIPEITIGEHGSFDAIVYNEWRNCKYGNERKEGYYSLLPHVETLTIQSNTEAVCDLDSYVSGNYKIQQYYWGVHQLRKNITIRINGVKDVDEQINRLKNYFGYIFINDRKALGSQCQAIANIKLDGDKIQQQSTANADKRNTIARADAEIAETRRSVERARARLGRRRTRFQEYLAFAE